MMRSTRIQTTLIVMAATSLWLGACKGSAGDMLRAPEMDGVVDPSAELEEGTNKISVFDQATGANCFRLGAGFEGVGDGVVVANMVASGAIEITFRDSVGEQTVGPIMATCFAGLAEDVGAWSTGGSLSFQLKTSDKLKIRPLTEAKVTDQDDPKFGACVQKAREAGVEGAFEILVVLWAHPTKPGTHSENHPSTPVVGGIAECQQFGSALVPELGLAPGELAGLRVSFVP